MTADKRDKMTYSTFTLKTLAVVMLPLTLLVACNNQSVNTTKQADQEQRMAQQLDKDLTIWPKVNSEVKQDPALELKVQQTLKSMTLAQKVAQMIQPEIRDITPEDMRKYGFGSYLNGGGAFPNNNKHSTPQDWIELAEKMYQASIDSSLDGSTIPTMWGTDAVHGHNNVIGATLFPHNIGLGAANNAQLIEKIAEVTATEVMVTGIDWVFAPTVATVRDDRWGRTYEGYSEDPEIVKAYAAAIVKGLQGHANEDFLGDDRVISTVKHFVGDGGTVNGDDQGNNIANEQELFDIHGQGYVGGLTAGAQSVMASFNSWQGEKIHGSHYLLTDVLKDKMGFDGFVVGDWNGHGQVKGCTNDSCPQAVNAGLDIFMVPTDAWKPLLENTIKQTEQGIIPMSRIDDAVTRILRVKYRAGLFNKPSPAHRKFSGKTELIGSRAHREIARQAVRESLVLLKNKEGLLPLSPKMNMLVLGDAANNIGKQSGGWTITWQGTNNQNSDFPGGSSIYDGLAKQVIAAGGQIELSENGQYTHKPDVAVVVYGEEPYAEGQGDRKNLAYQAGVQTDLALLKQLKAQGIPVVSVFISGRPMWVNAELNASDAFVAAWLPGSEGVAVADVLLKDSKGEIQYDFKGKLSFSWPNSPVQVVNRFDEDYQPLLPYGFGLRYGELSTLSSNLSELYVEEKSSATYGDVFYGKVEPSLIMLLTSGKAITAIESNSAALTGIEYRTVDKLVQEDAFRLTLNGQSTAGVKFTQLTTNNGPSELSNAVVKSNQLSINVKRESEVSQPIWLSINCIDNQAIQANCQARYNIAPRLSKLPLDTWQTLSISLSCFNDKIIKPEAEIVPFQLHTNSAMTLSLSTIVFEQQNGSLDTQCH